MYLYITDTRYIQEYTGENKGKQYFYLAKNL